MSDAVIAISSYGAQRITHPTTRQTISAHKIGYSSAASAILLALYGERARDVSPRQASYHYLQIDGDVVVRHGCILLKVTPDEVGRAEALAREHYRAGAYLWRDGRWWELPNSRSAEYAEVVGRAGPDFDPSGLRVVAAATGEKEAAVQGIRAERSQRSPHETPWYWLLGDTYPHRDLLKRHGARFSGKRKAWYLIAWELPDAIQALVNASAEAQPDASPGRSGNDLLAIFGGQISGKETAANGDLIVRGANRLLATRTTWLDRDDQPEAVWVFDLPPDPTHGNGLQPLHDALKVADAHYSYSSYRWYFDQPEQVAQLDALAAAVPADDAPCSVEEAAAILGMAVKPETLPATPEPARLFALGAMVYARHDLVTPGGKPIPTGTAGKIARLYNRNLEYGYSYDVDFDGVGTGWFFERELTDIEPIKGVRITRGFVAPPGAVPPPTDGEVRAALAAAGHRPEPVDLSPVQASIESVEPNALESPPTDEPPRIRITKPQGLPADGAAPDAVQAAIRDAKAVVPEPIKRAATSIGKRTLARIPQSYVGELTGSITGNVYCYGYSVHEGICVYVNLGGPRMAVEAIRAKLSKGDIVTVVPWDAPSVELTAGEGSSGMYHDYFANIPEARFTSLILLHDSVIHPNYGGKATTFLLYVSDEQTVGQLHHHVAQLVKVPVFDAWAAYLWSAGQTALLVRKTRGGGGLTVYAVDLDSESWTRLITGGIEQGVIALP